MKKLISFLILLTAATTTFAFPNATDTVYDMHIRIGNTDFQDVLLLRGASSNIITYRGPLRGSITVPGVFTSELSGRAHCHPWNGVCALSFEIMARENGREFLVRYRASMSSSSDSEITGSAYLEDGSLLGNFTAIKRTP